MLAIDRHGAAALAVEIREPISAEIKANIDAIGLGRISLNPGADARQVVTDLQSSDTSLRLIGVTLLKRRTAEEAIDVLTLQHIREHMTRSKTVKACYHSHISFTPTRLSHSSSKSQSSLAKVFFRLQIYRPKHRQKTTLLISLENFPSRALLVYRLLSALSASQPRTSVHPALRKIPS